MARVPDASINKMQQTKSQEDLSWLNKPEVDTQSGHDCPGNLVGNPTLYRDASGNVKDGWDEKYSGIAMAQEQKPHCWKDKRWSYSGRIKPDSVNNPIRKGSPHKRRQRVSDLLLCKKALLDEETCNWYGFSKEYGRNVK